MAIPFTKSCTVKNKSEKTAKCSVRKYSTNRTNQMLLEFPVQQIGGPKKELQTFLISQVPKNFWSLQM